MSFSFDWNLLTITEVLGIILAVIGFFNLSEKLEAGFAKVRVGCSKYSAFQMQEAKSLWPPHKHFVELLMDMFDTLPTVLVLAGGYIWLSGSYEPVSSYYFSLPLFLKLAFWGCVFLALVANELFSHFAVSRVFGSIAWIFEKAFGLLAKPPSGITGTLGLVLSLIAFGLGHVTSSA